MFSKWTTMWEMKPRMTPSKEFLTVNGTKTGHKA